MNVFVLVFTVFVHDYICMYVFMYVCMYVYMYVCIFLDKYLNTLRLV